MPRVPTRCFSSYQHAVFEEPDVALGLWEQGHRDSRKNWKTTRKKFKYTVVKYTVGYFFYRQKSNFHIKNKIVPLLFLKAPVL